MKMSTALVINDESEVISMNLGDLVLREQPGTENNGYVTFDVSLKGVHQCFVEWNTDDGYERLMAIAWNDIAELRN